MAKKKGGRRPTRKPRAKQESMPKIDPPDPRAIEAAMRELFRSLPGTISAGQQSQLQAEEYLALAYDSPPDRQQALARKALDAWPDCADAYVLLAEHADSLDDARRLFEQGVEAGRRAIGNQFNRQVGHFWLALETRPYMRARLGLAQCLYSSGQPEAAADHFREMLRLNPNDNQGIRELLLSCLFELSRDDEVGQLLDRYDDDPTAAWTYGRALHAFRTQGDCPETRSLLKAAVKANKHVPPYLLGAKALPETLPAYVSLGDASEAVAYFSEFVLAWKSTPGAISWLRASVEASRSRKRKKNSPSALEVPRPVTVDELRQAPLAPDEVWQVDARRMSEHLEHDNRIIRPWLLLVTDATNDLVLNHAMQVDEPDIDTVWACLGGAMVRPAVGLPRRPGTVEVTLSAGLDVLKSRLAASGVRCVVRDDLEHIDQVLSAFSKVAAQEQQRSALVDVPGVTPEQLESFYQATAGFFRRAPWLHVPGDTVIEMICPQRSSRPFYAVVMGQCGIELGLALYDDLRLLRSLMDGSLDERAAIERMTSIGMTYEEAMHIAPRDLEAIERRGWPIAGPEAYPQILRLDKGQLIDTIEAEELERLEIALRAIPDFLADKVEATRRVTTAGGTREVTIKWG